MFINFKKYDWEECIRRLRAEILSLQKKSAKQEKKPNKMNKTPKRSKAMDMRFHWLKDRECQQQFKFYWRPGKLNHADYWTKHHSATHHVNVRKEFLTPHIVIEMLRMKNEGRKSGTTPAA